MTSLDIGLSHIRTAAGWVGQAYDRLGKYIKHYTRDHSPDSRDSDSRE